MKPPLQPTEQRRPSAWEANTPPTELLGLAGRAACWTFGLITRRSSVRICPGDSFTGMLSGAVLVLLAVTLMPGWPYLAVDYGLVLAAGRPLTGRRPS